MREIKFRVWHPKSKRFSYWGFIDNMFAGIPSSNEDGFNMDYVRENSNQYTGLHDRNGKEIWEGDIVKFSAHYFGDRKERERIEVIEWDEEEACYNWKLTFTGFADGPNWNEVIGNRYENPELLAKETDKTRPTP